MKKIRYISINAIITIGSLLFLFSCTQTSTQTSDLDTVGSDKDITLRDTDSTSDEDDTKVNCNYKVTDNKIKPNTLELSFSGYYKTFAGTKYVEITNSCFKCDDSAPLVIDMATIITDTPDETAYTISVNPVSGGKTVALKGGDRTTFGISCEVSSWTALERVLRIHSNDVCNENLDIKLSCLPKFSASILVTTPDDGAPEDMTMDFGDVSTELVQKLVVTNAGNSNLKINNMNITVGLSTKDKEPGFFIKKGIAAEKEISPLASETAEIGCRNSKEFPQKLIGELEIINNDITEDQKNHIKKIALMCGPKIEKTPTAVLVCDPKELPILTWPKLDGSGSTDIDGVTKTGLSYFWSFASTLTASIVDFNDKSKPVAGQWTDSSMATFQALLKGTYQIRMMVKNQNNVSSNWATCDINSISDDDLAVKMIWDNMDSDIDLHLVSPGGAYGNSATDCYYYNCSPQYPGKRPDWGVAAETKDDPALDYDNTTGMGPETIYINRPANGVYKVVVHAYNTDNGPSGVVVKAYNHSVQAAVATTIMSKTNTCWDVFNLTVTDGTGGHKNISAAPITPVTAYECKPPDMAP